MIDPAVIISLIVVSYFFNAIGTMVVAMSIHKGPLMPFGLVLNIFGVIGMGVGFYAIMAGPSW
jgi:hypothetical protein